MSNVTYLGRNIDIKTFIQPGRVTFVILGLDEAQSVYSFQYKKFNPVLNIEQVSTADSEQGYHQLVVRNMDLNEDLSKPWFSLAFATRAQATQALALLYESIADARHINDKSAHASVIEAQPVSTRSDKLSLWLCCSIAVIALLLNAVLLVGLGKLPIFGYDIEPIAYSKHAKQIAFEELQQRKKEYLFHDAQRSIDQAFEKKAFDSAQGHKDDFELKLNSQAIANLKTASRLSGVKLYEDPNDLTLPFWLFIDPTSSQAPALLKKFQAITADLKAEGLNGQILPIANGKAEDAAQVVSSLCDKGQTDHIKTIPSGWLNGKMDTLAPDLCQGAINRVKLSTKLFEYLGFLQAPVLVARNGSVTAVSDANSEQILEWIKARRFNAK